MSHSYTRPSRYRPSGTAMMLSTLLLLPPAATTAAGGSNTITPEPRLNRRHCSTFYEHAGITATTIQGIDFAGVVEHGSPVPHVGVFDTPLYDDANIADARLIGRLMGSYWSHVAEDDMRQAINTGLWNFNIPGGEVEAGGWITASLGFGPNNSSVNTPNVITGGTGDFVGYIGTVEHRVARDNPFVIEYTICPPSPWSVMEIVAECVDVFTWDTSQPSMVGNHSFTGDVSRGKGNHVSALDNPAFASLEAAQGQDVDDEVIGRNIGVYFPDSLQTTSALFNFQLFGDSSLDEDIDEADWIATSFGFSFETALGTFTTVEEPNVIIGGSGKYSGIVGTIEDTVKEFDPAPEGEFAEVNYYKICSDDDPFPSPVVEEDCTVIYELSVPHPFSVGGYNFSGSVLAGEDDHLGVFNSPFFFSPDVENSTLAGRIMGHYFLNERGAATGQWNFHFFDRNMEDEASSPSGWLTGNLGFGKGDYPDVVVGGTGDWKGFEGRIRPLPLADTDPPVISWTICPEGKGFAGGNSGNGVESMTPTVQGAAGEGEAGSPTDAPTDANEDAPTDDEDMNLPSTSAGNAGIHNVCYSAIVAGILAFIISR